MEIKEITEEEIIEEVKKHPKTDDCKVTECIYCGYRDCPENEPLHYHHDGCPACLYDGADYFDWANVPEGDIPINVLTGEGAKKK